MTLGNLNYWPVLVAAIVTFAFGWLWYGVLSKQWYAARGLSPADADNAQAQMGLTPLIVTFISLLVMAWMFAGVLLHLARGGMALNIRAGMISGFFLWLGFVITTLGVNYTFQGAKRALVLIDGAYWLGVLLIQGAILG
jgi:hypothetical protein